MRLRNHAGNALWIAMGTLLLASIGAAMLVRVTRGNLRLAGLTRSEAQARWAAHAALTGFANRLKMRPWAERFFAKTPGEYTSTLTYRGHPVSLWARDSTRGSELVTGVTDVFARAVDGDVGVGVYQRVRVMPASATNPRALRLIRELTVREDLTDVGARDALLAKLEDDERAAEDAAPGADCCARALDDAGARDVKPDEAFSAAQAARSDEGTEKRFRESMRRARRAALAGDLVQSIAALQEAASTASGGSPAQSQQRRMAAEYALSRAQYALAIASAEPDRSARLADAATRLDALVNELGSQCIGPSAAYLKAQVNVMQRRRPAVPQARAASQTDQEQQQARTVRDIGQELEATLRRIAPGSAFEHETVLASEIPAQFERTWNMPVAYSDTFNEMKEVKFFWFFSFNIPWPVVQRIAVTDDRGLEARSLTVSGQYAPHLWLSDGQALVASDLNAESGSALVVLDRNGRLLRNFKGVTPCSTSESGGVWLSPAQDELVIFGNRDDEKEYGYFAQSLMGGPARKLSTFTAAQMGFPTHDPVTFSPDGSRVAYLDYSGGLPGVRIAAPQTFLRSGGAAIGGTIPAFRLSAEPRTPPMAWVLVAGVPYLVVAADADDATNTDAGQILLCHAATGNATRRPLPAGFLPGLILPHRTQPRVTILDQKLSHFVTYDLTPSAINGGAAPQELAGGPFSERPGRGPKDVVYLARNVDNDPALFRWDLSSGQPPERLPVPLETGPTKLRRITAPVGF